MKTSFQAIVSIQIFMDLNLFDEKRDFYVIKSMEQQGVSEKINIVAK